MSADPAQRDPLELIAEEFIARYRRGECPSVTDYVERHPELAAEIRELFPALVMMEDAAGRSGEQEGPVRGHLSVDGRRPEQIGEYRIICEIGRGGMGIVYQAEHAALGRHVALKVLLSQYTVKPRFLARFRREARAAARLHHTNIVPVFDVGECDGVHFYVMQYIRGQGLDKVVLGLRRLRSKDSSFQASKHFSTATYDDGDFEQKVAASLLSGDWNSNSTDGQLDPDVELNISTIECESAPSTTAELAKPIAVVEQVTTANIEATQVRKESKSSSDLGSDRRFYSEVARIGLQVADALAYAHKQHIVHRDIKPSNVLLDSNGTVWITDFGLVKEEGSELTYTGELVGTLQYMAPEQFSGKSDARSDIYSLGVTLYELLTLKAAFAGSDPAQLLKCIIDDEPTAPRQVDPRVPRDLETIVLKAMAKAPDMRYLAADDLAEDLRRFLADRPIRARPVTMAERGWRWMRRNPYLTSLLAAVMVLLLVIGTGSVLGVILQRERDEARTQHQLAVTAANTIERLQRETEIRKLLADAAKLRVGGKPGRCDLVLDIVQQAVALKPDGPLRDATRDEAIAALALTDVQFGRQWEGFTEYYTARSFDPDLKRCSVIDKRGGLWISGHDGVKAIQTFINPTARSGIPTFSPDGQWLAVAFPPLNEGRLQVWNIASGQPVFETPVELYQCFDFSHDGRCIATNSWEREIRIWELSTGKELNRVALSARARDIAFDADDRRLAVCFGIQEAPVLVYDLSGKELEEFPMSSSVFSVAWHPESNRLAFGTGSPDSCQIWDCDRRELVISMRGHQGGFYGTRFDTSGSHLISDSIDGSTKCWDPATGKEILTFQRGAFWVNGRHTVSFSGATNDGPVSREFVFQPSSVLNSLVSRIGPQTGVVDLSPVDPKHNLLAVAMAEGFSIWDLSARRELIHEPIGLVYCARFDWEDRVLLTASANGLERWPVEEIERGQIRLGPPITAKTWSSTPWAAASISTIAHRIALLQLDNVTIFDSVGAKLEMFMPKENHRSISLSPDGRWFATYGGGDTSVFDAQTGVRQFEFQTGPNNGYAPRFTPDSKAIFSSRTTRYDVWDVATGELKHSIEHDCAHPVQADCTLDGRTFAVEKSPGTVTLIDMATGRVIGNLESSNSDHLNKIRFVDDGSMLLTSVNGSIQVWDLRQLKLELSELGLDWD